MFNLYPTACYWLARCWPRAWRPLAGYAAPGLYVVCGFRSSRACSPFPALHEVVAPAGLHLLLRLLLWPFALVDWVLSDAPLHWLRGIWRLPDFSAGPPLP